MTLGRVGDRATNDNVMVGSIVRDESCNHIEVLSRHESEAGWRHQRQNYQDRTWDNYDTSWYWIVSHPIGRVGDRATNDNVTEGTVVRSVAFPLSTYRCVRRITDTLGVQQGCWRTEQLTRNGRTMGARLGWENFDRNHYTIESQPHGLVESQPTTTTEPTTNPTNTGETTNMSTTLGDIGDTATRHNVMQGTIVSLNQHTDYRIVSESDNPRNTDLVCEFNVEAVSDGSLVTLYLGDSDVTIVSHPVQSAAWEADLAIINEELLSECRARGWCSDFDRFVRRVNARTTDLKLTPSRRNVHVSFRLRIDDSNGLTDAQIREAVRQHANGHLIRGEVLIRDEAE